MNLTNRILTISLLTIISLTVGSCNIEENEIEKNDLVNNQIEVTKNLSNLNKIVPTESFSSEYYQYLFSQSIIGNRTKVLAINKINAEKFQSLKKLNKTLIFDKIESTVKIDILLDNVKHEIYVLPTENGLSAISYIEKNNVIVKNPVEFSLTKNGYYNLTTINQNHLGKRQGCRDGANQIIYLGTGFAGLGLAGCIPCAFSGGAIVAITSAMAFFCND